MELVCRSSHAGWSSRAGAMLELELYDGPGMVAPACRSWRTAIPCLAILSEDGQMVLAWGCLESERRNIWAVRIETG